MHQVYGFSGLPEVTAALLFRILSSFVAAVASSLLWLLFLLRFII